MTVCGAKAVLEGAFGIQTPFIRTPKFSVDGNRGDWKRKKYRGEVGFLAFIELTLGVYFSFVNFYAWDLGIYGVIRSSCCSSLVSCTPGCPRWSRD